MASPISPLAPASFPEMPNLDMVAVSTAAAGIKYQNRTDLALITFPESATVAGVFTQSETRSAAVDWCRQVLNSNSNPVGILVNSGNSNAFTGKRGLKATELSAELAAEALNCKPEQILLASTGVIGEVLPTDPIANALKTMKPEIDKASFKAAAEAIMTTDTFAKGSYGQVGEAKICGIAKGSGMIAPDMATMLAFVFTDAAVSQADLQRILSKTTVSSFNSITVDSDTSTSDTLIAVATGEHQVDLAEFELAFEQVLIDLAQQIVRDGEGATKFIEVQVAGATTQQDAKKIALSIANSPLVKTAIAGEDANWGRIVMAVGKSGATANRDLLSIAMGGVTIAENGGAVENYDEKPVAEHMSGQNIRIDVDLGLGGATWKVWTCDLTHGYISINADYRS